MEAYGIESLLHDTSSLFGALADSHEKANVDSFLTSQQLMQQHIADSQASIMREQQESLWRKYSL